MEPLNYPDMDEVSTEDNTADDYYESSSAQLQEWAVREVSRKKTVLTETARLHQIKEM